MKRLRDYTAELQRKADLQDELDELHQKFETGDGMHFAAYCAKAKQLSEELNAIFVPASAAAPASAPAATPAPAPAQQSTAYTPKMTAADVAALASFNKQFSEAIKRDDPDAAVVILGDDTFRALINKQIVDEALAKW